MLAVVAVENSLRKNSDMEMRGWNDVLEKQRVVRGSGSFKHELWRPGGVQ